MENFMSIGEMAKIRNIDVQSLRYYEKLGILIPAYVNPENGYRYYSMEQIMILDTIILCIDLGIPLKELKGYVNESGQLEFEHLLNDGRKLAKEKMEKINAGIDSIDRTLKHINEQKNFKDRKGYYTRYIFERYVLTIPCEEKLSANEYEKNLSILFNDAKKYGLHASFPHGIISTYSNGKYLQSKMFLEVTSGNSSVVKTLSEGNYDCLQESREVHSNPLEIFAEKLSSRNKADVIISSMSPNVYKYDKVIMEIQLLA